MKSVDIIAEHRWKFAMELFAAEVMIEMNEDKISIETIKRIVDEHRALWAPPKEPLSPITQRGLIAEMEVVKKVADANTPNHIVSCWRGPRWRFARSCFRQMGCRNKVILKNRQE